MTHNRQISEVLEIMKEDFDKIIGNRSFSIWISDSIIPLLCTKKNGLRMAAIKKSTKQIIDFVDIQKNGTEKYHAINDIPELEHIAEFWGFQKRDLIKFNRGVILLARPVDNREVSRESSDLEDMLSSFQWVFSLCG